MERSDMSEKRSFLDILEVLTDALGRSEMQTVEEVTAELQSEGLDVNRTVKDLMNTVQECSMSARRQALDLAREKRLADNGGGYLERFKDWTRDQLLAKIKDYVVSRPEASTVSFRELDSAGEEDLRAIAESLGLKGDSVSGEDHE
jgi:hypothetical protein